MCGVLAGFLCSWTFILPIDLLLLGGLSLSVLFSSLRDGQGCFTSFLSWARVQLASLWVFGFIGCWWASARRVQSASSTSYGLRSSDLHFLLLASRWFFPLALSFRCYLKGFFHHCSPLHFNFFSLPAGVICISLLAFGHCCRLAFWRFFP